MALTPSRAAARSRPLLAYLMADPETIRMLCKLSSGSAIIGRVKTWTYVGWVALFSTLAGLIYGAWVDGTSGWLILVYLSAFLSLLALGLYLVGKRNIQRAVPAGTAPLD